MPGNSDYDPKSLPLARRAPSTAVYRYRGGSLELLPNIRCLGWRQNIGPDPGSATFRYVFENASLFRSADWPTQPEHVFANDAGGRYVVKTDDRIVVKSFAADGSSDIRFDGFAQIPTTKVSDSAQAVTFEALGVAVRCWDSPLWRSTYRDASDPESIDANTLVELPIRFNPQGRANATDAGFEAEAGGLEYPVFLDDVTCKSESIGRRWTVAMAVKYVLATGNAAATYVTNPVVTTLDDILDSREPVAGDTYDPSDPATYTSSPIELRELDVTGLPWPEALDKILSPHGFYFHFELDEDSSGLPTTRIVIARLRDADELKYRSVMLQPVGQTLDVGKTNVASIHLHRDTSHAANQYRVEGRLREYEATFILAPLFQPAAADAASPTALKSFRTDVGSGLTAANASKYRDYGVDETGEGHWDWTTNTWVSSVATSFEKLFSDDAGDNLRYTVRRRPGKNTLFTKDALGKPRKALLEISADTTSRVPGLDHSPNGTWYPVAGGTWNLLPDRLGIRIIEADPNAWKVGNKDLSFGVNQKSAGGVVRGVEAQALAGETRFHLRLTCVIDGDSSFEDFGSRSAVADRRSASPTSFTVERIIDGRERYRHHAVYKPSKYSSVQTGNPINDKFIIRDDSAKARADAVERRSATEMAPVAGPVVIRRLVGPTTYSLGRRITKIEGREISLRQDVGADDTEGASYPMIVGIEVDLGDGQQTTLRLSDFRGSKRS